MSKYVCPMHPEITSDRPGTCPKCHMNLVTEERFAEISKRMKKDEDGSMDMMGPGMAKDFLKRFYLVSILLIPLFLFSMPAVKYLGIPDFAIRKYLEFIFASAIFYFALVFFEHARMEISMKKPGMMSLVSLGIGSGYLFSAISTFVPGLGAEFYLETTTLIWILLFGHYLEAKSSGAAGDALDEVAKLLPKLVHLITKKGIKNVPLDKIKTGDQVLVKPGEKVPADGEIISGSGSFNISHLTGESIPVEGKIGAIIPAGAISVEGSFTIMLTKVGESSTIGQIKNLIEGAKKTKPSAQRLADKAAGWLAYAALSVSLITVIFWFFIAGQPFNFAITLAITVLVIACPHALGLAIPTVSTIATKLAIQNGVFIKDLAKIETVKNATYVVFDKTGTLTKGNFAVTGIFPEKHQSAILQYAASVEQFSEHPIAKAILDEAGKRKIKVSKVAHFKSIAGIGVEGFLGKNKVEIRRPGATVYLNGKRFGVIEIADEVRPESELAISDLHRLGVKVAMLTGDKKDVAEGVGKKLNIDTIFAEVMPKDKYKYIRKLQKKGNVVVMAGDGVNDAPALTQADAGVAIGAGTDVAIEAGDIVLMQSNPEHLVKLFVLSRKVYRKMIENLFWATGYNMVAIPAAAGVFIPIGFQLSPAVGALAMSLSSVIVVVNALSLRKTSLSL